MAKNFQVSYLLDIYGAMLTDKQRDAVDLYYNEDLSLAEISEHQGITRQGVRDSIKRAESILLDCDEKLGFAQRLAHIQEGLDEIVAMAGRVMSDSSSHSIKTIKRLENIIQTAKELAT